ncbi:hypothetical protein CN153_08155 [Sinorhizobium meliloti]|nr:hypothetical protein [Sinorhizobium meliloti]RVH91512.1 hypothetical protein CN199_23375 [Sinorhizobium meliloti]RVK86799.1 hypothetical protein CN153_08155 [Sinorhizobium meliloti]RVL22210.1 hypothetical protein CN143_07540 [Sinorhizobium meliloti]RVO40595.1 hypothetical protein CN093_12300 [Sinorhizobium meliloti]
MTFSRTARQRLSSFGVLPFFSNLTSSFSFREPTTVSLADTNRAAGEEDRCSSGRDVVIYVDGSLPCSIQGNRFERRLPIFYSHRKRNQSESGGFIGL